MVDVKSSMIVKEILRDALNCCFRRNNLILCKLNGGGKNWLANQYASLQILCG